MCFNKESSITFYIFGLLCSIYLIKRGLRQNNKDDILSGALLVLIAQMQIIEFFLWKNQKCNQTNRIGSFMIIFLLWLQPFLYYWICYYFNSKRMSVTIKKRNIVLLTIGSLLFLYCFLFTLKSKDKMCSLADKDTCRLVWAPMEYVSNKKLGIFLLTCVMYFVMFGIAPEFPSDKYTISGNISYLLLIFTIISLMYFKGFYFISIFGSVFCLLCLFYGVLRIFRI